MPGTGTSVVICPDGRVIPVASGVYVHKRAPGTGLSDPVDEVSLARASFYEPRSDATLVHLAPGAELSSIVRNYLEGLPDRVRDHLVVVPTPTLTEGLDPAAVRALEELTDLYHLPIEVPVALDLRQSPRAVPIDGHGHQVPWPQATAVRLLDRPQAAARVALGAALAIAQNSEPPPSMRRLEQVLTMAAETEDDFFVPPETSLAAAAAAAEVAAVVAYLGRYGVPPGLDVDAVGRSTLPRAAVADTVAGFLADGVTADVETLVEELREAPGSAVLVRSHTGGATRTAWLMSGDADAPGLWWVEPQTDGSLLPVAFDPDSDDGRVGALRAADTRVSRVDRAGLPVGRNLPVVPWAELRRDLEDRLAVVLPQGRAVGDALEDCLDRLEAVRRGWFGAPVAVDDAGLGTGRVQDRLAAALGGDWRPVGDSLGPVVGRLRELGDGAVAFVLVAPPAGPRHGIVVAAWRGGVFVVETQNVVGERVWDVVDGAGNVVAPAWLPGLLGARVIVAGPDGVAVPFADGGLGSAVTGATTVNALVDPAPGLRYLGSADEGEFSNILFGMPGAARLGAQIAMGPHGAQLTLELKKAYTDRNRTSAWRNRPEKPFTAPTLVPLAEFVAPVSSSFPNEPGADREAIHEVRKQVAEAFSTAHFSDKRQPLSDVLTPEMGWLIHPDWQNVQIGQRLIGGWTGILPQYNHDVPFAGVAKFLEFVAENTWRTKVNGHPHWAKEHLNDGLNLGLRVAADYVYSQTGRRVPFRELLERPHAETETIRGLIALNYVTFAMGSMAEWRAYDPDRSGRGTLKNDAAALLRNDKRLVFQALPAGVREFFAAQGAGIMSQFKAAFRARFGLPLGIPDYYLTQAWNIEEHSEIRDGLGQPRVDEDGDDLVDVMTIVPINTRMALSRLVIEVRAYKAREVDVRTVQTYTEEIVHQEREAYYHAERLEATASSGEGIGDHFMLAHDDSPSGVPGMALSNLPASDSEQSDADESASVVPLSPDSYGEPDLAVSMAEVRRELEDRLAVVLPPGREVGVALEDCLDRLEAVRRGWFGAPVVVDDAGLGTGRVQDRLAAALGGDWRPVGDSFDPLVTRLRGLGDGATAFVLVSPPAGPRHGIVLTAWRGGVFAVETQNRVGQRVWDAVDGAGHPVAPPWLPGLLGARVIVAGPDGVAVPFADGEAGSAVTGATTANALVDPSPGLRYLGSADEGEFSNILIGVAEGTRPQTLIAMGPHGIQLTLETRDVYSNRERTSFWQSRPHTPWTEPVYAPLAEFVAPVSSSLPGEPGEDRQQIHRVRRQVARAFRLAHDSGTPQLLSELLTPEMGWQMHPARQNVQVGQRLIGGWTGILPQYNHDVPFAGVAKFLEFVAENTWRTKTNGHPHWAKEHLNDGLNIGLQVAADYVNWRTGRQVPLQELLDRPHVETETIRGVIALYYETFAMGSMAEFHSRNPDRARRGTLKNDAAVLVRNDKRLIYQELPEGIKAFFAAQSADILSQFKVAFHTQFGLPADYLTRDWDIAEHPDVIGGLGQLAEVDPNIDRLRELNGEDFEDVDAEQVDTMTIVPINRRMPLSRVVIEVRAYKVREAPARAVQTYTEELVAQEIEAYSHAERLTAAAAGGQDVGDHFTSDYFDSTFGAGSSILPASAFEGPYPDAAYPGSDTAALYDLEAGIGVPDQSAPPVLYTTYGAGLSILPASAFEGPYPDAAYPGSDTAALYDLEAGIGVPDQSPYTDPSAFPESRNPFSPESYWESARPAFSESETPFSPDSYGMPDMPIMDNFPSSDGTAEPAAGETSRGAGRRGRGRRAPEDVDVVRASGERPAAVASLVGSAEIDELRLTVLPRTANTTAYDVVEGVSTERGLPQMVIDSHVAFQAEQRDGSVAGGLSEVELSRVDVPRVSLSRSVEGPVAFDYRVLEAADGRRVQDFTVRVFLSPRDATARAAEAEVRERVARAVDDAFNEQFWIGADQLHVNVEFVAEPELAHATVGLFGEEGVATTQTEWSVSDSDLRFAHEIGHYLGLPDEYVDPVGDERRMLLSRDRSSAVFGDNSLMATTKPGDRPQLQPRHLDRIAATVASEVSPHVADSSLPIAPRDPDEFVRTRPAPPTDKGKGKAQEDGDTEDQARVATWGWKAVSAESALSAPVQQALTVNGLRGLADQSGMPFFAKVAASAGYQGDQQLGYLDADSVRTMVQAYANKLREARDWSSFGVPEPGPAPVQQIDDWIAGGLDPDQVPGVLTAGLPASSAATEVLLRLTAPALARQIQLIRADGTVEWHKPSDVAAVEYPVITLVEGAAAVLATVPLETVPAVLAAVEGSLISPVVSAGPPVGLPADELAFNDLASFLAAVSGDASVTLPPDLSDRLRAATLREEAGLVAGPGLEEILTAVREAVAKNAKPLLPAEPSKWQRVPAGQGYPELTTDQANYLADGGRAAVWNPAAPSGFFEALLQAAEHDQYRLRGLSDWPAAELRVMFGALLRADLAAAGDAWPLLGATSQEFSSSRDELLKWVTDLSTPGVPAPTDTPKWLAPAVAQLFGVNVLLVEPDVRLGGAMIAPDWPQLVLVTSADGRVMATVPADPAEAGTVRRLESVEIPAVPHDWPGAEQAGGSEAEPGRSMEAPETSAAAGSAGKSPAEESVEEPSAALGRPKPEPVNVPAAGELIGIDPSAYPMGVPKEGLPHLDQLTAQLRDALRGEGVTLGEDEWLKLRQRLLANYRKITSPSGYLERQGHLDLRFRLEMGEARAAGDPAAPPVPGKPAEDAKGKESPIRGVGAIQMTVATGGDSGSRTGQTSATRGGLSINGSPPVLKFMTFRAGPRFTATMNKVDRSTGYFTTAETAHVDDTRSESVLTKVDTKWSFSIGKGVRGEDYRWSAPTPVVVTGEKQPLVLWMPLQYVGQPSADQVRAIAPAAPQPDATPQEIEIFKKRSTRFEQNRERIPRNFFAAGLGGLSDLYADGVGLLQRAGLRVDSGTLLQQVARALWNLDTHLDTAVNDPRGYVIPLVDEVGRDIGRLVARGRRKGTPRPVGTPSNQAHLEKVRTAISTHTSGFNLTNESGLGVEAAFDLVKAPMIAAGPEARMTFTATNSDGVSASRNGLNVLVSRYTGYTVAFNLKFDFDLELTVLNDRNKSFKSPRPTPGETLLRIPEKDAFDYSFPVDRAALKEDVPSAKEVPFVEDAVRDSRAENEVSDARLPAYLLRGRGAGHALVEVDTALPGKLYEAVSEELRKRGYVSNDLDLPFAKQLKTVGRSTFLPDIVRSESEAAVQSRQRNDRVLRHFLSSDSLDSHYDQAHQDGMFLTLRRWNRYGHEKIIRVSVVATQELTEEIDPKNKSSVYIKDLTDDYSTVNLAMGLDVAGQSAGGSTNINFGLGGYARVAKGFLGRFGLSLGYTRSVGAVESNNIVTNMPQLQESTAKAHELELPSEYKIKLEFEDDKEKSWSSDAIGATATVHLLEDFNVAQTTTPMRGRAPQNTPPEVMENAVVLHLDSTGVLAAARKVLRGFTKPGREADEPTSRFTSNVTLHAHLKEMMADRYTTDSFFRPGFFRHQLGSLGIKAEVGRSTFVGVTNDNFTLGLIKLSLTQSSQNANRSHKGIASGEFTFGGTTPAPSGEAADHGGGGGGVVGHGIEGPGATGGSAATPTNAADANYGGAAGLAISYTRAYTKKRGARQTGGKEYLELNFARAYVFDAPAGFTVQAVREKHGKLMLNKGEISEPEKVPEGSLRYALSEPDALKEFAAGRVDLPENQLADVFERWISEKTEFSIKALVGALVQWHNSVADSGVVDPYRNERESWARKLAEKHRNDTGRIYDPADLTLFAETFPEIPLAPVAADEDLPNAAPKTYLPPYFLEGAPRALGHAGIHSLTYQDPSVPGENFTAYDLVRREIDKVVPGLLGRERTDWKNARVWRGSFFGDSGKSQIGRVQGGLDGLQAMLAGGRDQPLIEDMLGDDPFRFSIVNPMGWLLSDVVDVKISVKWRDGEPEPIDLVPESGLENYFHGYQMDSTGKGRDSIYSATLKGNFAPTYSSKGTTVGGAAQVAGGQRRSHNQHVERIEEATAYSWTKAYHYRRPITISIEANRQMMPGRVVNNILAKIRRPAPRSESASYPGELIVKLPQGLVESPPVQGPAPLPTMHPLPKLPADLAVISFRLENALPVAEELLRKTFGEGTTKKIFGPWLATSVFGKEADNYRPSLSLSTLLSPHHLSNHLPKMLAGQRHRLTPTLLEPGHSRVRADFHIWGELHELRVVRMIDEGMGTGRYVKDISNNSVNVSLDKPDAAASLEVGQSGTVNDRQVGSEQMPDKMSGSTPFSRQAPLGSSADANLAQRGEQHSKQLGPSYLVEVKGRFFLEMAPYKQGLFSSENKKRGNVVRSAPIFGEGYIQAFGEQIEEMQRQLHEFRTAPTKEPTPWPAAEGAPREVDLDRSLFEAAKNGGLDAPGQVAQSLRQPQEKQPTLIFSTHVGQRAYLTYKAVSEWEFDLRYPGAAADSDAARAANQERLTTLDGLAPKAETPAGVRELEGLVDEAIARAGALGASPPSTLLRALGGNPVYQAQEIAFRLNTHVEVRQAGYRWRESASPGDPETAIDRISPDGRITPVNYPGVDAPAGPVGEPQASRSGRPPAAAPAPLPPANSPVQPPVPAPQGSRWDGNTLVIGTWGGPSFNELTQVGHWSAENPPGILIAVKPTLDKGAQLVLDQLRTALQRTARIGVIPTVVFWNTPPGLLAELRADYAFSTLQRRVVNLDDSSWQLSGPDGRLAGLYDVITDALDAQKSAAGPPTEEISARLASRKLPPALAGWLSENNWQDRETYLRAHFQELLAPEVQAVLGRNADGTMTGLPAGEDGNLAGAAQVILDLVRANGGPAAEDAPRLAPAADIPSHKFEPPVTLEGPLRETFAFDYLLPRPKPKPSTVRTERASWDDLLLRLFSMGKLTGPQMVALANGVAEGSRGVANATVFAAIAAVMRMPQKVAELPTHDNSEFGRLADAVANCDVLPADRVSWVARFDAFHEQVAGGQPGHAALLHVLLEKLTNC
ncbi:hypothetical protein [Micromonospora sp. CA-111912]|uniref:hypothetical protein n=1 Tax=Micromonospora sp. CA-111912 TaxID=3239955 RepID=UPI003D8E9154